MSNHPDPGSPRSDVHVIGGGLGGLAAAALVARAGRTVTVHEGRGRLGGRGTTDEKNGFRFNQGPHALYVGGEGHRILRRLGILPAGRPPTTRGARMVDGGRVGLAPGGPGSLLCSSLLGWRDKLALARVLNGVGSLDPGSLGSISVGEWVSGLSSRTRVRDIVHTVVRLATYVNAPGTLSAEVASMQLRMALGSGVIYLDRGWQQLVESLGNAPGVRLSRGDHIDELPDAPCVIVATGAPRSAGALIGAHFDVGPGAEVAVLDVALRRPPGRDVVLGIDPPVYLSNHGFPAGMTPAGASSVSVAEYLASDTAPDRDRLRRFLTHAGITPDAVVAERYLHRMLAVSAIATAESGGLSGRPTGTVADHPGVYVVGDWVGARGHLLDAVLASAQDAARQAIAHLDRRPVSR